MLIYSTHPGRRLTSFSSNQHGVALVVGLIFLLITTLIAVTAMSGVVMQERMAGNLRNTSVAFTAAESGARAGELYLHEILSLGDLIRGRCNPSGDVPMFNRQESSCPQADVDRIDAFRSSRDWIDSGQVWVHELPVENISDEILHDPDLGAMSARPLFIVEHMGDFRPLGGVGGEFAQGVGYDGMPPAKVYRVTARGQGISTNVSRAIEVQYAAFIGGADRPPPTAPSP